MLLACRAVCRHVGSDIRALRLQGHLVDVSQHLRRTLCRVVTFTTESQAARCCHIRVNLNGNKGIKCSGKACIAARRNAHVLEAVPAKQRAERLAVSASEDVVLVLLNRSAYLWVSRRRLWVWRWWRGWRRLVVAG